MWSVQTNDGALAALRVLRATDGALATTERRIATGLRVESARDDASTFVIAQTMRGQVVSLEAIGGSLAGASSVASVAVTAAERVTETLVRLKALAVAAIDPARAPDRAALTAEFAGLTDTIGGLIASAQFNGLNLLRAGAEDLTYLASPYGGSLTLRAADLETGVVAKLREASAILDGSASTAAPSPAPVPVPAPGPGNGNGNGPPGGAPPGQAGGKGNKGGGGPPGQTPPPSSTPPASTPPASSPPPIEDALRRVEEAIAANAAGLSSLAADANRVDAHRTFLAALRDTTVTGIGALVDANLAEESSRLAGLRTARDLAIVGLRDAAAMPRRLLALYVRPASPAGGGLDLRA